MPVEIDEAVQAWYRGVATYLQLLQADRIPGELVKHLDELSEGEFAQYRIAASGMRYDYLKFKGQERLQREGIT